MKAMLAFAMLGGRVDSGAMLCMSFLTSNSSS